jgi:hypothetical protein
MQGLSPGVGMRLTFRDVPSLPWTSPNRGTNPHLEQSKRAIPNLHGVSPAKGGTKSCPDWKEGRLSICSWKPMVPTWISVDLTCQKSLL